MRILRCLVLFNWQSCRVRKRQQKGGKADFLGGELRLMHYFCSLMEIWHQAHEARAHQPVLAFHFNLNCWIGPYWTTFPQQQDQICASKWKLVFKFELNGDDSVSPKSCSGLATGGAPLEASFPWMSSLEDRWQWNFGCFFLVEPFKTI